MYISMLKDGFNMQCLASIIFLFFACISPIVTFGGLMGQKTDGHMVSNSWTKRQYINVYQWLLSLNYVTGRSDLVVSAYTTAVWEDPGSNLTADGLCISRRPLWYAALGTGCALAAVPRSTQPYIPIGSLNRVPASAGTGREWHLCRMAGNTAWYHTAWEFRFGEAGLHYPCELLCYVYLFTLLKRHASFKNTGWRRINRTIYCCCPRSVFLQQNT